MTNRAAKLREDVIWCALQLQEHEAKINAALDSDSRSRKEAERLEPVSTELGDRASIGCMAATGGTCAEWTL